jgi:preprotein translocase subunit SecB
VLGRPQQRRDRFFLEKTMSNTNNGGEAKDQPAPPQLNVMAQYVKDFSFENPNAPASLGSFQQAQPAINIAINVQVNALSATDFEVILKTEGKAEREGTLLFSFDLAFGGVFRLQNIPQENLHPAVMIECPRLLFPFSREIISTAVRNGGFPPLLLDPVDFVALYRQNLAQQSAQGNIAQA